MTVLRLEQFPNVCLLCLQNLDENTLVPIDEYVQRYSGKVVDLINILTVPIPSELHHYTPSNVCLACFDELNGFLAYRKRLDLVVRFVSSLAQVAQGKIDALEDLVSKNRADLLVIFQELNLIDKDELIVQDILDDISQYGIGSWAVRTNSTLADELQENDASIDEIKPLPQLDPDDELEQRGSITSYEEEWQYDKKQNSDPGSFDGKSFNCQLDYSASSSSSSLNVPLDKHSSDQETADTGNEHDSSHTCSVNSSSRAAKIETEKLRRGKNCKFQAASPLQAPMEKHKVKEAQVSLCKRCNITFGSKQELTRHKRSAHRDHTCDTCGIAFECNFALQTHRKRHGSKRPHKCEYCPMNYFTLAEKTLHVRQAHLKVFEVRCTVCALSFPTKPALTQHMKSHTDIRTHTCTVCGFSFKTNTHLIRHMRGVHQGVQYSCEHCSTSYRRKDKLRLHVEKMHNIQTYFVCDICLQSYNSAEKLEKHKEHHQNPKDLQCNICLGAYLTQEEFDAHLCITYRDNYVCCFRDFKFQSYYNKHMFLVHGEKTNVRVKPTDGLLMGQFRAMRRQEIRCPRCDQKFSTRTQKKNHMRTCETNVYREQFFEQVDTTDEIL